MSILSLFFKQIDQKVRCHYEFIQRTSKNSACLVFCSSTEDMLIHFVTSYNSLDQQKNKTRTFFFRQDLVLKKGDYFYHEIPILKLQDQSQQRNIIFISGFGIKRFFKTVGFERVNFIYVTVHQTRGFRTLKLEMTSAGLSLRFLLTKSTCFII